MDFSFEMFIPLIISAISMFTPRILEWIKSQPWLPFLQENAPTLNRIVAVIVAVGQAVGVTFAFSDGTLVVTGLNLVTILTLGVNAVVAFLVQQLQFRSVISPKAS